MKAFLGLLSLVFIIGNGLAILRRQRRSGEVQDYGHPIKDNLLLLGSAIVLAAIMFAAIWWMGSKAPELRSAAGQLFVVVVLAVAAGITYIANYFVRSGRGGKSGARKKLH
jgi:hypothetical protein